MTYAKHHIAVATLSLLVMAAATPAQAGGVAAGTLIENTASASFSTGSGTQTVQSNTVTVLVDELLDVTLASQDSGSVALTGNGAILTFELTNLGNGPEAFRLTADPQVAGNDFDVTVTGIAIDEDGDGQYNPAIDRVLGAGEDTPVIAADGSVTLFAIVNAPAGVSDAQLSALNLRAEAVTGTGTPGTVFAGAGENGGNAVVGLSNADADDNGALIARVVAVALTKTALVVDPFGGSEAVPGAIVTYTLTADVSGTGSIDDLVVSDAIPAGTTYRAGTLVLDTMALSDAADTDAGSADAAGISVNLGTVAAGAEREIAFSVTID